MEKKVSMMPHLEDPERLAAFQKAAEDKEHAFYGCFIAAKALSHYLGILSEVHYQEEELIENLRKLEDAVWDANEAIDRCQRIVSGAPLEKEDLC
ncbi:MAG: hypothetical protein LHW56_11540 [Candidatus Cloacimonetes bacterium]|nr:hypothetical protein [Candidatus Cloacimonadota bacterium]MDY0173520.1 hypothetical protein [Candidatus Cloacimonadaceae bacterium]